METHLEDATPDGIDRQQFLKRASAGVLGAAALTGGLGADRAFAALTKAAAQPKRGGTLRCGFAGGSDTDTVDGDNVVNNMDFARVYQLYDGLVAYDENARVRLQLAEELTPNKNATSWTIRVKPGITFHNGKDLTADDVLFTLRRIVDPKKPLIGAPTLAFLDLKNAKKLDKRTCRIPCHAPFGSFVDTLPNYTYFIVPVGFNPKRPVGTGPFKFQSFTPGRQSTFVRNGDYWDGPPYLDKIVMTDFADEESQINALLAGQVDVINFLSAPSIASIKGGGANVNIAAGASLLQFTMRVDAKPFNDVRVRQAMRLIIDREEMRRIVFLGHGILGNDLFAYWDPVYDHSLPQRHQDIAKAKSLLKAAGQENLTIEFVTAPMGQGAVQMAQVLAQQAKKAGVNIKLRQLTVTNFFGPNYLKWVFSQDTWQYFPYFPMVAFSSLAKSPANETHFADPTYAKLYKQGLATVDAAKRKAIAHEMQRIDYEKGGYIIPFFPPTIDAYSKKVHGLREGKTGVPFNQHNYKKVWID
ncbi:MAG TPA: ABC transporter substrate-binding protein [Gaiellaceae bacterium]|nr:ABC transporter substrate-binding protein [Gaiellaceae bacterium]